MIYIGSLLILTAIISIASFSYAIWSNKSEQRGKLNIVAGILDYELISDDLNNNSITIPANANKTIEIEIRSLNNIESKYELYYVTSGQNVKVGYSSETVDSPTGTISSRSSKKVTVVIKNKTSDAATITFGCQGGFSDKELVLAQGNSINEQLGICTADVGDTWTFDYNGTTGADGSIQDFEVPCDGYYKLETWGASGGSSKTNAGTVYNGGYGGYSEGNIYLTDTSTLYLGIGGKGENSFTLNDTEHLGGYNGGGKSLNNDSFASGGGATHIALNNNYGELENYEQHKSDILIVSGGGGAASADLHGGGCCHGGSAGGYTGGQPITGNTIAQNLSVSPTQTTGYAFGQGQSGRASGGAGGWYGSATTTASFTTWNGCTAGGSSYIANSGLQNKKMYCYNCVEDLTNANTFTVKTNGTSSYRDTTNCPNGYSDSAISKCAKLGNGYARITYLGNDPSSFIGMTWAYNYTGSEQEFSPSFAGKYKVELWGASGGAACTYPDRWLGGLGGYTSGIVELVPSDDLYIYVGQQGSNCTTVNANTYTPSSWNGGGSGSGSSDSNDGGGSGGGATDIRKVRGNWNSLESLQSRIMVAGAGAGSSYVNPNQTHRAPSGGGLTGVGTLYAYPNIALATHDYNGTQTTGYAFGLGGNGYSISGGGGGGGAGGWYGGYSISSGNGFSTGANNGGSGSSYISGHTGCVGITAITDTTPKSGCTTGTTDNSCSLSPYNYSFTDTKIIDGAGYSWTNTKGSLELMPNPTGGNYASGVGHSGNGYAKITYLGEGNITTLYSAAVDEVYYYDSNNTKQIIGTTDATGKLENVFIPNGVRLYSSIAKDPNNLSNPYSKAFNTISNETYLMPDGEVLYWYGYDQFTNPLKTTFLGRPFKDAVNVKNTNSWQLTLNGSGTTGLNSCMYVTQDFIDSTNLSSYNIIVNSGSLDLYSHATTVEMDYYTTTDVVRGPSCYHEPVTSPVLWTMDISEVDSVKPGIQLQTQNPSYLATVTIAAMWLE